MARELLYKAGLTLKVVSWENDGDYYKTMEISYDDLEKAKAMARMCRKLFKSSCNHSDAIGNSDYADADIIEAFRQSDDYFKANYTEQSFLEFVCDNASDFLGWGEEENISYRVCESATLYNIKEDVWLDKVEVEI